LEAEERLAKAEAHLRRANEAARLVRAEIPIASREVDAARRDVEEARRKVIQTDGRDCIARLLQEAQDMQNALIERRIALRYLWHFGFVSEPKAIEFLLQGDHLVATYTSPEAQNYAQLPASKLWRDTVAALATDADAALPT
jgi:hypothetical protein